MTHLTDHLTKLTCAVGVARDSRYFNTAQVLDRLILDEKAQLKTTLRAQDLVNSAASRESEKVT